MGLICAACASATRPARYWHRPHPSVAARPVCSRCANAIRRELIGDDWKTYIYRMDGSDRQQEPPRRARRPNHD